MSIQAAIAELDKSIAELNREQERLTKIKNALIAGKSDAPVRRAPQASVSPDVPAKKAKKKRKLSPEGRQRILEANKRRWARDKKAKASK